MLFSYLEALWLNEVLPIVVVVLKVLGGYGLFPPRAVEDNLEVDLGEK